MVDYIVTRADESELEHHGVKGQKWGVRRYKKARSQGLSANAKLSDARHKQSEAQGMYERSGNKMYKHMAKRDIAKDKAASAKSGSKRQARLVNKSYKYNQKVKDYSKVRTASRNEVLNAKSDAKKAQRTYDDAVRKAAKEKVQIKDYTIAKHLLVASINAYAGYKTSGKLGGKKTGLGKDMLKTDKDEFDEAVMAYRNKVH